LPLLIVMIGSARLILFGTSHTAWLEITDFRAWEYLLFLGSRRLISSFTVPAAVTSAAISETLSSIYVHQPVHLYFAVACPPAVRLILVEPQRAW